MKYTCILKNETGCETWEAEVRLLKAAKTGQYEAEIEGRGTYFHILTGQHKYGDYLCIPNHDVGCERSRFSDFFWNRERISRLMREEDAVTVATGLMYLESLIKNKASD
ncbi:MAG: hypothetical protein K2I07_14690 [Lachnospiraceae bacterium]|nr:hypothetical protein [Lachnospiraceae bacterium]